MRRRATLAICFLLAAALASAQSDPASLPARDEHEGLLVAADPCTDAERAKKLFGKKTPLAAGIVPVEVVFRNDNDKPILVTLERIELLLNPRGGEKQRLSPLPVEDVVDRILYKGGPNVTAKRIPIPGRTNPVGKDKEWLKLESLIRPHALETTLVPPKATVRGFLYFHLGNRAGWLAYARLYVPEVKFMHNKQPLFFFEVDLSKVTP
jgi:hypothetical protein